MLSHYLKILLSEIFPDKINPPPSLNPEQLLRELQFVPEEDLCEFYTALGSVGSTPMRIDYLRKALELAKKKYKEDASILAEYYVNLGDLLFKTG